MDIFSADIDVYGLRRQQMELLTLCAVRGLLTTRTRLRKVLMQPPDNGGQFLVWIYYINFYKYILPNIKNSNKEWN